MGMSAPKPEPNDDEDVDKAEPENKLTLDNLAEGFWWFMATFDFFYNVDPSMIQALKQKQTIEEDFILCGNNLEKWKTTVAIAGYLS